MRIRCSSSVSAHKHSSHIKTSTDECKTSLSPQHFANDSETPEVLGTSLLRCRGGGLESSRLRALTTSKCILSSYVEAAGDIAKPAAMLSVLLPGDSTELLSRRKHSKGTCRNLRLRKSLKCLVWVMET
eukprot:6122018-Amphidinium_carterae.1